MVINMYHFVERLHTLYGLLQDEKSKEIFQARFALDMEHSVPNIKRLVLLGSLKDQAFMRWLQPLKDTLKKLNQEHKKIILYGTAYTGKRFAEMLQLEHIDFYGFCGREAERFSDGLFGKPVFSPDELVAHRDEYYVVPAVSWNTYPEISQFLQERNYPEDHILDWVDIYGGIIDATNKLCYTDDIHISDTINQYFEFPELYRPGTVFIDGGCFDCESSYKFAEWCGGAYSSIIAFEADPDNYSNCCKKAQDTPLPNFRLINAGLSSQEGTTVFDARGAGSSRIPTGSDSNETKPYIYTGDKILIRTATIDDIVGEHTVGFIKLDVEGAEFNALHGAKKTIVRDKPFLAVCVYHRKGDVFTIMDYLHQLLPEYRFLLRHYSDFTVETVLYASVDL